MVMALYAPDRVYAQAAPAGDSSSSKKLEEVVVTGIRRSLESAQAITLLRSARAA